MPHGEYPEADQGKCRSCGFLSKHATKPQGIPPPRFYEAEHSERITVSAFFRHAIGYREGVNTEPMCFRGKINLVELIAAETQPEIDRKLETEIWEDRKCEDWYPYMPGLSPIEHYDQLMMQKLEADRRDYEQRTEESRRRYEERMAQEAESDRRRYEELNEGRNRTLIIASIILAVVIGLAEIIAAVILNREAPTDQLLRKLLGQ